jgi:hypothetical protein
MNASKPRTRPERSEQTAKEYFLEQAAAYFDEMKTITANAPHGQAFNHAEAFVMQQGQELLRQSFEATLQDQIDDFEKKKKRHSVQNANRKNDMAAIAPKNASASPER